MQWEKVKETVARGLYTFIERGNAFPQILLANIQVDSSSKHPTPKEYADFAWNTVMQWDIRGAGSLRKAFPHYFPKSLRKGNFQAFYGDKGWELLLS